ncbi:MAG: ankyrin repeat domain-containing protein, partial [Verrucomicrobia bacterium]|nr:ankyrin repeat domain-containing protein [Verrucomicrobiota bacterium]
IIEAKADVNKLSNGGTPLRIAVCGQDLEVVKLLLANGANPNAETFSILSNLAHKTKPGYYNTVMHEAVEKGSLPIAKALLAAGADPNRTDHEGKTPLAIAQEKGFTELVTLLQGRTTVQSAQASNVKPSDDVWRAASEGRLADLQQLVASGANVNASDAEKATPLHKAATAGQLPAVKWLLEHGASLNAKMRDRSTPLLLAASAGQTEVVKFLVLLKANVEAAERGGHTPFTAAVVNGHLEIADLLLRHGANPNHRIQALLNMTALMYVAGQKLLDAVEFLLAAGANANLCDARGQNALHHAISGAVMHEVVDLGPGGDVPEGRPEDALPIVQRLLAYGADPNARDEEGKTPLFYARKLRLTQITSVLEMAGKPSLQTMPTKTRLAQN